MKLIPAAEANKETDIFVGMWRPPFHEIHKRYKAEDGRYFARMDSNRYYTEDSVRQEWLEGKFDEPLYQRLV